MYAIRSYYVEYEAELPAPYRVRDGRLYGLLAEKRLVPLHIEGGKNAEPLAARRVDEIQERNNFV